MSAVSSKAGSSRPTRERVQPRAADDSPIAAENESADTTCYEPDVAYEDLQKELGVVFPPGVRISKSDVSKDPRQWPLKSAVPGVSLIGAEINVPIYFSDWHDYFSGVFEHGNEDGETFNPFVNLVGKSSGTGYEKGLAMESIQRRC
jgi:hypothetical protein